MNISRRIEQLESLQASGGESAIDASLLTDAELQELMDKKHTGGTVSTAAYGKLIIEKPNNDEVKNDYKIF